MSTKTIRTTCSDCGAAVARVLPDGDGIPSRWVQALAKRNPYCDSCMTKADLAEREQQRIADRETRRSQCQIPRRFRGLSLPDLDAKDGQATALTAACEWADSKDPGGLMLTGDTGVGKTRIATAACWSRLEQWPCLYVKVAQAMARLGGSFQDEGRHEAVRVFSGEGPVVLDDFDKTRVTDYGLEQLSAAVDSRYQAGAPMLITTNLMPGEIGEIYGEPIMSRLIEYCRIVAVGGGDRRLESRTAELKAA